MKRILSLVIILFISSLHCSSTEINVDSSQSRLDKLIGESQYNIVNVDLNQDNARLHELGKSYLDQKYDSLTAEKIFRHLVNKEPKNPEYLYEASRSVFYIGEFNYFNFSRDPFDLALNYIERALKIKPDNAKYLLMKAYSIGRVGLHIRKKGGGLFDGVPELTQSQDIINQLMGNDDIAELDETEIAKIINKGYVLTEALLTRVEIYKDSPEILGGSKESAFKLLKIVKKIKPNNLRARLLLAIIYKEKKEYNKAITELNGLHKVYESKKVPNIIDTNQVYALSFKHYAQCYWSLGQYEDSKKYIDMHLKERPRSNPGYKSLASYYLDIKKDKETALKYAEKAYELNPYDKNAKQFVDNIKKMK